MLHWHRRSCWFYLLHCCVTLSGPCVWIGGCKSERYSFQATVYTCRQCFRASELTERGLWIGALGRHSCVLQHQTGISLWLLFVCVWKHSEPPPHAALDLEQSGAPRNHTTSFNDLRRIIWERIPVREGKMHLDCAHFPHRDRDGEAVGGVMLWTMRHGPNWFWFGSGCKSLIHDSIVKILLKTHIFPSGK